MDPILFHHYDFSPFSEKVRLAFGLKGLSWRSIAVPAFLPKPELVALTGGYRHTPVMQIGAEVFCDTRRMIAELDRRFPRRLVVDPKSAGLAQAVEAWVERDLFWPLARHVSGVNAEEMGAELHADRAVLRGKGSAPGLAKLKAVAQRSLPLVLSGTARVENMLADGRPFLLGAGAGLADLAVYHGFWFLSALPVDCSAVLEGFPGVRQWMARVAAIGHGSFTAMSSAEALRVAAEASLPPAGASHPAPSDPPLGAHVSLRPEEYTTEETSGRLVRADVDEISLERDDPSLGAIRVHFPRAGYAVRVIEKVSAS